MKWNKSKVEHFLPQVSTEIQLLQPGNPNTEDIYIWKPLSSGTYTTKSGYFAISTKDQRPQEQSTDMFDWVKDIWSEKSSPKMKLMMWSIAQDALPLGELLQRRGMQSAALCTRCQAVESSMHTFFHCPFAQEVWSKIPLNHVVHLATDSDFKKTVVAFRKATCLPPSGVSASILPWVCWALWTARNTLIFEKRSFTSTEVATKAIRLARKWIEAQPQKSTTKTSLPTTRRPYQSEIADGLKRTCMVDAAYDAHSRRAGLVWIFKDSSGSLLSQGSSTSDLVISPLIAEALTLRSGIISAVNLEFPKLKVSSDNLMLIRAIHNDTQVKEIFGIVKDIQQISSVFVEISFVHVSRSSNEEADRLPKQTLSASFVSDPLVG